ncbi:MAG: glycosyltransferase family 39 protein [Methanobacterium sp.]|nr:glycosyltransferase family 39 protein [Methanobacterium sp.]
MRNFFYTYLVIFFNVFIKNTLISIRFISLLFGLGLLILSYYFIKKISDKTTALISSFFLAINNFLISCSIQGRSYMTMFFFYFLFLYCIFFKNIKTQKEKIIIMFISVILALNYEYVFLVLPLLILFYFKTKNKFFILLIIIISILFLFQVFYITKSVEYTLIKDTVFNKNNTKPVLDLNIFEQKNIENGYNSLIFYSQIYFYLIIFLILIGTIFIKNFYNNKIMNSKIKYLLFVCLIQLIFFSFFFKRESIRYRGSIIILYILIIPILYYLLNHKKKLKLIVSLIIILIYFFTPLNISYPPKINYEKQEYINNYDLFLLNFKDPLGYNSINYNNIFSNYSAIKGINLNITDYIIITTDIYNLQNYIKIDYIFNPYLQNSFSYNYNNKILNVYNNIPFINLNNINEFLIENKKILIIADSRFNSHLKNIEKKFILNNFNLVFQTNSSYIGIINLEKENSIKIFKNK